MMLVLGSSLSRAPSDDGKETSKAHKSRRSDEAGRMKDECDLTRLNKSTRLKERHSEHTIKFSNTEWNAKRSCSIAQQAVTLQRTGLKPSWDNVTQRVKRDAQGEVIVRRGNSADKAERG